MKLYIFIETDSTDPGYAYTEVYLTEKEATERLRELYHEEAVERVDNDGHPIDCAVISDDHKTACVIYSDISIYWQVQEKEI